MKKKFLFYMLLIVALLSYAQPTPEVFIARTPPPPGNECNSTAAQKENYLKKVRELKDTLEKRIFVLKQEGKENAKEFQEQAKQKMANQYGITAADMEKMKQINNSQMSKEEKKAEKLAMAEKMMQQQNIDISPKKVAELKDSTAKKNWATSIQTEQMAEVEGNPDYNKNNQPVMEKNMSAAEMGKEYDMLIKKENARFTKPDAQFKELKEDAEKMAEDTTDNSLLHRIREKEVELGKVNTTDNPSPGEIMKAQGIWDEIKSLKLQYCFKFTPRLLDALSNQFNAIKLSVDDYYRIEELGNKLNTTSTGVSIPVTPRGLSTLNALNSYLLNLDGIFTYSLFNANDTLFPE